MKKYLRMLIKIAALSIMLLALVCLFGVSEAGAIAVLILILAVSFYLRSLDSEEEIIKRKYAQVKNEK